MPNWLKVSLVFIGTVIGGGFASGHEIIRFFIIYGEKAFGALLLVVRYSALYGLELC